jgi:hypothetical protein
VTRCDVGEIRGMVIMVDHDEKLTSKAVLRKGFTIPGICLRGC